MESAQMGPSQSRNFTGRDGVGGRGGPDDATSGPPKGACGASTASVGVLGEAARPTGPEPAEAIASPAVDVVVRPNPAGVQVAGRERSERGSTGDGRRRGGHRGGAVSKLAPGTITPAHGRALYGLGDRRADEIAVADGVEAARAGCSR